MLPLYAQSDSVFKNFPHAGLLFDKYLDQWVEQDNEPDSKENEKKPQIEKKVFYENVIRQYKKSESQINPALEKHLKRQAELCTNLRGAGFVATTDWRFLTGFGAAHPYEAGFVWHRTLSVPYLPGSSIKGMMRAWAEQWQEDAALRMEAEKLFGHKDTHPQQNPGALIIFDALPLVAPKLELDILTPHYQDYYLDPENNSPADYYDPVPVFFITVAPGQKLRFDLAPRPGAHPSTSEANADLKKGEKILEEALRFLGAGAKTALGYGRMLDITKPEKQDAPKPQKPLNETDLIKASALLQGKFGVSPAQNNKKGK
ncbi:type III-B CRISPR module RAMP protein Cmr6 [Desulfosarcina sp. OttesenSCG-928-A07]|nr:type III-B CRISPR module RAMP protein Cmr6 [Desulfosarcina sp. OttesenSCG-928-G17]MDL2330010.1 type III-B CRISPR module RAMP protein Cmr6 [Desulfosarcina sp. OttesenSCG-928-A07]